MRFVRNLSVGSTSVHIDYYPTQYFTVKPSTFVQILTGGAPTAITHSIEYVAAIQANVYTGLTITFNAGDVGKEFSLLVCDE